MLAHALSYFRRTTHVAESVIGGLFAVALSGCHGEVVTIGEKPKPSFHCASPRLVLELATYARTNNATLTADLLEIYFTSTRDDDDFDIWTAARGSRYDPFGMPVKVRALSSSRIDTGSAVSADGLTLWLGSDRRNGGGGGGGNGNGNGGLDIWVSTRAARTMEWGEPVLVPALSSPQFDIPRPPGARGLVMPLGTERGPGSVYRTFFATRASTTTPFETPEAVPELTFENATTMDAFMSDDGLTLLYASGPITQANEGGIPAGVDASTGGSDVDATTPIVSADLFIAHREKLTDPFSGLMPVAELNTFFDERDPWMSDDKTQFYFSSDRGGNMNIYTCDVIFK